jgi:hypothetical protein
MEYFIIIMEDCKTLFGSSKFQEASERISYKFIGPLGTRPPPKRFSIPGLDNQGIVVRFPREAKIFFCSSKAAISALKTKQPPFQWLIGSTSLGFKVAEA